VILLIRIGRTDGSCVLELLLLLEHPIAFRALLPWSKSLLEPVLHGALPAWVLQRGLLLLMMARVRPAGAGVGSSFLGFIYISENLL